MPKLPLGFSYTYNPYTEEEIAKKKFTKLQSTIITVMCTCAAVYFFVLFYTALCGNYPHVWMSVAVYVMTMLIVSKLTEWPILTSFAIGRDLDDDD